VEDPPGWSPAQGPIAALPTLGTGRRAPGERRGEPRGAGAWAGAPHRTALPGRGSGSRDAAATGQVREGRGGSEEPDTSLCSHLADG